MTDITAYIPQRPPFVMIDEVLAAEQGRTQTTFTVRDGHMMVRNGCFTESGLVENMAQTAAAGTGYMAQQEGKPPAIGYIGALKSLKVSTLPAVGDTITTEVIFLHQVLNVHVVEGKVTLDGAEIARCEFKIYLQADA